MVGSVGKGVGSVGVVGRDCSRAAVEWDCSSSLAVRVVGSRDLVCLGMRAGIWLVSSFCSHSAIRIVLYLAHFRKRIYNRRVKSACKKR